MECSIDECQKPRLARGLCVNHYARWRRNGDPLKNMPRGRANRPALKEIGYSGAHQRVYTLKGYASNYSCIGCGERADAWAYDHKDLLALTNDEGWPYSQDPTHYIPMCCSCHKLFDMSMAGAR